MTPTERERIVEEAEKYGFQVPYDGSSEFYDRSAVKAYIAGATAEHERNAKLISSLKDEVTYLTATGCLIVDSDDEAKMANHIYQLQKQLKEARNQAIDDVIKRLRIMVHYGNIDLSWSFIKEEIEQLKTKP